MEKGFNITEKELEKELEIPQKELNKKSEYNRYYIINTFVAFIYLNPDITEEAVKLNKHHGRDIFDKRTKGWQYIKEDFLYGQWRKCNNIILI